MIKKRKEITRCESARDSMKRRRSSMHDRATFEDMRLETGAESSADSRQPLRARQPAASGHRRRARVFFFQAEDGIRDRNVTGVQTCALPIFQDALRSPRNASSGSEAESCRRKRATQVRSEERRVGKECRSRWAPDD